MTRLHFADLTAITAPFVLLDDDTQQRLRAWPHGVEVLAYAGTWVASSSPEFFPNITYRARPAPLVQDTVDWSHVAEPFNWHARDADGQGYFYTKEPTAGEWMWDSEGEILNSAAHASYVRGTTHWRDSKISRPGVQR